MKNDYRDFLIHHGIKGMHWGIRRYQNPDGSLTEAGERRYAKGKTRGIDPIKYQAYKRITDPNKYGRLSDEQKRKYDYAKRLALEDEIVKRSEKVLEDDVWNKYASEYAAERYDKGVKKGKRVYDEDEREEYIKEYVKMGRGSIDSTTSVWDYYSNNDPKTKALVNRAEEWLNNVVTSEYGSGVTRFDVVSQVLDDYEEKRTRLERAKNEDKWDIDFIESVQNSKMMYDGDTKTMLKEYSAYLDDPDDYMQNRARKLKQA